MRLNLRKSREAIKKKIHNAWYTSAHSLTAVARRGASRQSLNYQVGRAWEKAGEWSKAAEAFQAAVDGDPSRPGWYFRLGRAWEKAGEWSKAAEAFQAAVDGDPSRPGWYFRLGRAWDRAGHPLGTVSAYQAALARDPNQPDLFYRLGKTFLKMNNFGSAAYCFQQADERSNETEGPRQDLPSHNLPFQQRIELSLISKPAYAYCIYRGAQLAKRLGIDHVSVLELGVAGGNGLVAMETHAAEIEHLTGVRISVFGLDSGEGLYQPSDIRDLPYFFAPGNYRIDVDRLNERLKRARLILGDARQTFAEFVEDGNPPIAAMAFDMDYYSSTSGVLQVVGTELYERSFLPRVYTYFDDVVGANLQDYNEFTGELLAIAEFNESHATAKFALDRHYYAKQFRPRWVEQLYTLHRFGHPDYGKYIGRSSPKSLRLRTKAAS